MMNIQALITATAQNLRRWAAAARRNEATAAQLALNRPLLPHSPSFTRSSPSPRSFPASSPRRSEPLSHSTSRERTPMAFSSLETSRVHILR